MKIRSTAFSALTMAVVLAASMASAAVTDVAPLLQFRVTTGATGTGTVLTATTITRGIYPVVSVGVKGSSAAGLKSISISGGYGGGTAYFPAGTKTAYTSIGFYDGYFPPGPYRFNANVVGSNGKFTQKSMTLTVVNP